MVFSYTYLASNKRTSEDRFHILLRWICIILCDIVVFSDFWNSGTFTFSFIVTELSMIETKVSPFWKILEWRFILKLKNCKFKVESWFRGAQHVENSKFLRKFADISRGFLPVRIKFTKFSQFFCWPVILVSRISWFIFSPSFEEIKSDHSKLRTYSKYVYPIMTWWLKREDTRVC